MIQRIASGFTPFAAATGGIHACFARPNNNIALRWRFQHWQIIERHELDALRNVKGGRVLGWYINGQACCVDQFLK